MTETRESIVRSRYLQMLIILITVQQTMIQVMTAARGRVLIEKQANLPSTLTKQA